jgi:hypothetical protein
VGSGVLTPVKMSMVVFMPEEPKRYYSPVSVYGIRTHNSTIDRNCSWLRAVALEIRADSS